MHVSGLFARVSSTTPPFDYEAPSLQLTPQIPAIFKLTPRSQPLTVYIFTLTTHVPRRLQLALANAPRYNSMTHALLP